MRGSLGCSFPTQGQSSKVLIFALLYLRTLPIIPWHIAHVLAHHTQLLLHAFCLVPQHEKRFLSSDDLVKSVDALHLSQSSY